MIETRSAAAPILLREALATPPAGEGGAEAAASLGTLRGHAAVFNQWARIDGWEGTFLERVAQGAFARSLAEDRSSVRVLFQHGHDAMSGSKPLGPLTTIREDDVGLFYELPLMDTSYGRDLLPGLQAGVYGASFRFSVQRETFDQAPGVSAYNERGIPERTLNEVRLLELGPCTFGAYPTATAGVRSGVFLPSMLPVLSTDFGADVTFTRAR